MSLLFIHTQMTRKAKVLLEKNERHRKDAGKGNLTPFPLYKYNYLMMDQGSLYKTRTAPKAYVSAI